MQWAWLTLPIIELIRSLLLLGIVFAQTKSAGLLPWSNNVLAFFFHGFDEWPVDGAEDYGSQKAMKAKAKNMLVELQPSSDRGRLVILNK